MHIWVIKVGELLPIDGSRYRPHRIGMLADALLERGHEVVWWASTLDHSCKQQRFPSDTNIQLSNRYNLRLIHTRGYKRNVSLDRLRDHAELAHKFEAQIAQMRRPDLIYCCFPTIELSCVAARFGREHGIPVVLDVRDLWPDNFLSVIPSVLRAPAGLALRRYRKRSHEAFSQCSAIIGTSEDYLNHGLKYAQRERTERDGVFPLGYPRPTSGSLTRNSEEDRIAEEAVLESLRQFGVDPAKQICWFVGMFGRTYDLRTVIEAARVFAQAGETEVQFVLSGTGDNYSELVEQARGLQNVVFTGRIDTPQVACMSRIAQVGLMAYTKGAPQGLPNKLFEYMSAGLPILSSLTGETAQVLKRYGCGVSYTPADRESLVAGLNMLLANAGLRRRMGNAGREAFLNEYVADKVYSRLATALEQLAVSAQLGMAVTQQPARSSDQTSDLAA